MPETLLSSFLVGMTCVSSFCLGLGNAESSARAKHANASNHVRSVVCKLERLCGVGCLCGCSPPRCLQ
jgi:hypothetical protein